MLWHAPHKTLLNTFFFVWPVPGSRLVKRRKPGRAKGKTREDWGGKREERGPLSINVYVTTLFPLPLYYTNAEPGRGYSLFNLHVVNTTLIVHSFLHLANKFENFMTRKTAIRWVIPEHTVKSVKHLTGNFSNWSSVSNIPKKLRNAFIRPRHDRVFLLVRAWSSN